MSASPLRPGIVSALVTPFAHDGSVDKRALDTLVDRQVESGLDGLFVLGTSGEGMLLSVRERAQVTEWVLERVAGRLPVAVHCGAADTATAVVLVQDAAKAGVRTVAAIPPLFFPYPDRAIFDHFVRLVDGAPGLDHYLYDNPDRVGYGMSVPLASRLMTEVEAIRGMKDTGSSLDKIAAYLATVPSAQIFTGNNHVVLGAIAMGASGVVSTTANVVPELFVEMYAAHGRGELDKARDLQRVIVRLHRALAGLPYVGAVKYLLDRRGMPGGLPRAPLPGLDAGERELLESRISQDGSLKPWLQAN